MTGNMGYVTSLFRICESGLVYILVSLCFTSIGYVPLIGQQEWTPSITRSAMGEFEFDKLCNMVDEE